jgi:hypothetical protein
MDQERPPIVGHFTRKETMDRIVLEQIGQITKPGAIVHGHHLNVREGHGPA